MGTQASDKIPDALGKRHVVISLSEGGTFTITRWSLPKTIIMTKWVGNAIKDMADFKVEDLSKAEIKDFMETAMKFISQLGDKLPEFMELCVDPIDKATLSEIPADDALEVLVEIIKLNITDKFLGKVKELTGLFKSKFMANGKST